MKLLERFRKKEEPEEEEKKKDSKKPLKRTSKKRKKEKIEKWEKKHRLLVLFVLLLTVFLPSILALSARDWKLPGLPRLKLPNLSFEQTFILEKTKSSKDFSQIKSEFKKKTNSLSGVYGFYVFRLTRKDEYGLYENEVFPAASLIKLPVLVLLYQEAEAGKINLDETYSLQEADKIGGAGSLQYQPAGTKVTFRHLAKLMGQESDNTAFNIVRQRLGDRKIQEAIFEFGMNKTSLKENETSPKDIGVLYTQLWQGELVETKSRDEILEYLTDTIYEDHLAAGIPADIRVAHKYAREVHVLADGGIVYTKKPFVVVIMSKGIVESEGDQVFPELSKTIYSYEDLN